MPYRKKRTDSDEERTQKTLYLPSRLCHELSIRSAMLKVQHSELAAQALEEFFSRHKRPDA